jgi:hypothetical protein
MHREHIVAVVAMTLLWALPAHRAAGHPGSGIAVDDGGRVYFTDTLRGVWRIDDGGKLTLVSDSAMHWMAIDRRGNFAHSPATFGEWFGRLTPEGEKPALISCSDFPCVVGKDGNLYYAKMHGLTIIRRTPGGEESVLVSREKFGIGADRPIGVNGMACGPDGAIYLASIDSLNKTEGSGDHAVYAVAGDGSVRTVAKNFVREKLPEGQRHPEVRPEYCRGIAVNGNGDVYVAVTGNRCVMKLTAQGEASVVLNAHKPWTPTGVDVRDREVYVLEYDDETPTEGRSWPPRVRKVGRDGSVTILATVKREGGAGGAPR